MGEPNVNYNSKSKRETIRGIEGEEERGERKRRKEIARGGTGPGKERDEICLRAGGSALCD